MIHYVLYVEEHRVLFSKNSAKKEHLAFRDFFELKLVTVTLKSSVTMMNYKVMLNWFQK